MPRTDRTDDEPYVTSPTGHRMYVDPDDDRARELAQAGGALSRGSSLLWDTALGLDEWDVVVDVGANYGEMMLGAPVRPDARKVCFEPNPRVLPYLRRSIEESGIDIDLREIAVGAADGEAAFVADTEWSGRSGLAETHRTDAEHRLEEFSVPVRTLDSELALRPGERVCVKVDVEGAEFDVLDGARELVRRAEPWAILVEVLHMDGFEKARLAEEFTMRTLDRRGGELVTIPPVSARRVDELLRGGWLHGQDVVLTARHAA